jgi:hypothetical protein
MKVEPTEVRKSNWLKPRYYLAALFLSALFSICFLAILWVFFALWYFEPLSSPVRYPGLGVWIAAVFIASARKWRRFTLPLTTTAGIVVVLILWSQHEPRLSPTPNRDQARFAHADISDSTVEIRNIRNARYRSSEDYDVAWETRRYDLNDLCGADFVVEPFFSFRALAHTLISFGFMTGEHLAVSFEIEHQAGRTYNPLRGLFRQYTLRAIVGDERDLIGLRSEIQRDDVFVYPLRLESAALRRLFLLVMDRVNSLGAHPEFYDTIRNNCTTQYRDVYERLTGRSLRTDPRVYLPGYTDDVALGLGLIDWDGDISSARSRFQVNGRAPLDARAYEEGRDWSRRLRRSAR